MSLLEKYYRVNLAVGVHIHINADATAVISVCLIAVNGDQLEIGQKVLSLNTIGELKNKFSTDTPLAICLTGKGILNKQIEKTEFVDQTNFGQILTNANVAEFYVQNFISGERSFISAVRRTEADRWIDLLTNEGFVALSLTLGPFAVENILPQLNIYGNEIVFNRYNILRNEQNQWIACSYKESSTASFLLKIETEVIDENLVIAYAVAFQLILAANLTIIQAEVPALNLAFTKKLDANKFKIRAFLIAAVLFILLLINFMLFSFLNSANAKLTLQVSQVDIDYDNVQTLGESVKKKEILLQDLGWEPGINKSSLADQLAALMPEEITLKEVTINPIDVSGSRTQKKPIFFNRRIKVTGFAGKIMPVNEWMARLKTKAWIKTIQLENYAYNNEISAGQFTIILNY